mmetsp:Transcript_133064/g.315396  ORF Transcript_133064/g.315396 Transcript_133064/m.315396 type:complete len:310 (+) Transcript_133064:52-981(+)
MGCGASSGASYESRPSRSERQDEESNRGSPSSPKAKAKGKAKAKSKAKNKKGFCEAKDVEWHVKNCLDSQFELVKTVREAYPFDANKKKSVHKKENVRSGGIDDLLKADNWGTVEISDIGPTRLLCDVCGVLMVDIYTHPENPFYVCRNCQRHGRKLELCTRCFQTKAHKKDEEEAKPRATRTNTQNLSEPDGSAGDLLEQAHRQMTSGTWQGHFEEEGGKRKVEYELFFSAKGVVSGQGSDGCQVTGRFLWDTQLFKPRVEWTEKHDWGTLKFTAIADFHNKELEGEFEVSDGGGGKGLLRYQEPTRD